MTEITYHHVVKTLLDIGHNTPFDLCMQQNFPLYNAFDVVFLSSYLEELTYDTMDEFGNIVMRGVQLPEYETCVVRLMGEFMGDFMRDKMRCNGHVTEQDILGVTKDSWNQFCRAFTIPAPNLPDDTATCPMDFVPVKEFTTWECCSDREFFRTLAVNLASVKDGTNFDEPSICNDGDSAEIFYMDPPDVAPDHVGCFLHTSIWMNAWQIPFWEDEAYNWFLDDEIVAFAYPKTDTTIPAGNINNIGKHQKVHGQDLIPDPILNFPFGIHYDAPIDVRIGA